MSKLTGLKKMQNFTPKSSYCRLGNKQTQRNRHKSITHNGPNYSEGGRFSSNYQWVSDDCASMNSGAIGFPHNYSARNNKNSNLLKIIK